MPEKSLTSPRVQCAGLSIDISLDEFVRYEIMPDLGLDSDRFWASFAQIVGNFAPRNQLLLEKRDLLQSKIDAWHLERQGQPHDNEAYRSFLESIGYLVSQGNDFKISTENIDPEICKSYYFRICVI